MLCCVSLGHRLSSESEDRSRSIEDCCRVGCQWMAVGIGIAVPRQPVAPVLPSSSVRGNRVPSQVVRQELGSWGRRRRKVVEVRRSAWTVAVVGVVVDRSVAGRATWFIDLFFPAIFMSPSVRCQRPRYDEIYAAIWNINVVFCWRDNFGGSLCNTMTYTCVCVCVYLCYKICKAALKLFQQNIKRIVS